MMSAPTDENWQPKAVVFDLLTGLLNSWDLWDASTPSKTHQDGGRWRQRYLEITFGAGSYKPYEELVRQAAGEVGLPPSAPEALLKNWSSIKAWDEVPSVLQALKAQGYKLGVITNCSKHSGYIAIHGVEEQASAGYETPFTFDAAVTAEESGFYKPVKEAYHAILPKLGVDAEDILFVAGSAGDVEGATNAGMKVVWHNKIGLTKKGNAVPLRESRTLDDALKGYLKERE
ncbi:had-superfamily subfamily variant 2 [Fusarium pseudoanthophilum]|uniref:Had-superfamily subfamily variant 2 n=1 Tax=Fusarium pseudoanthophilum TaxID=48495 RepID=A0A8H5P489_9HYPO|nr:had-superfamily subfamily variant 2 [Fusarium pseudoanthophilum]